MSKTHKKTYKHEEQLFTDHGRESRNNDRHIEKRLKNALRSNDVDELFKVDDEYADIRF